MNKFVIGSLLSISILLTGCVPHQVLPPHLGKIIVEPGVLGEVCKFPHGHKHK